MATAPNYVEKRHFRNVAIVGGGLSLSGLDHLFNVDMDRSRGHLVAVNDAWRAVQAPGDIVSIDTSNLGLRFSDCIWKPIIGVPEDYGTEWSRYACDREPLRPGWKYMRRVPGSKLSSNNTELSSGENSGFAAMNLAFHMRPRRIFLFGIDLMDMQHHWHPHMHERKEDAAKTIRMRRNFNNSYGLLRKHGIEVINCSRMSTIEAFEKVTPERGIEIWNTL